jgi:protein translocase SecG subunit
MTIFLQMVQVLASIVLIVCIILQTTKSEQSGGGGGMGWGIIGGKSSASIRTRWGVEEHLDRITTYAAAAFLVTSLLAAIARMR